MTDFGPYDYAISLFFGVIAVVVLILGGPLWAIALVYATGCTVMLYRHLPLPPRRR
jgi:hypothetical protein